jgi:hypothetical protein
MSTTGSGQQVAKNIKGFFKFSTFITGVELNMGTSSFG